MFENIPRELRIFDQFVCWRFEDRNSKKPTKVPYSPKTGKLAKVNDPETWSTYEQALHTVNTSNCYDGLGFVLTDNDPYAFIDLDDTRGDSAMLQRQIKIFNEFDSYAERSPGGNGLHIIVRGQIPSGRRRSAVEIYSSQRYMTVTGDIYRDAPIRDCDKLLQTLYSQMGSGNQSTMVYLGLCEPTETDEAIVERATSAANGEKFAALYSGNWEDYYPSQSEADLALVDIIAFYSKSRVQISRIFRASGLGQREKARRDDYVAYMLNKCFDQMLPPVDVDDLNNKLNDILAKKKDELSEAQVTPSLNNSSSQGYINEKDTILQPSKDIYLPPPGLLGEIAQFIYAQAPRPIPEIALAGAIGMLSGIVGRSYNVSGTGLNQYTLLLANTGAGKEAMARGIDRLINEVVKTVPSAAEFIGPAEIASSPAIIKYMSKGPTSFVSIVGEFGIRMQQMASANAAPHLESLRRFLLHIYNKSGEGAVQRPTIYADKDKNTQSILSPAFSLLGESTPETFYEGLHEGLISEGLLPRFTIIEYLGDRPPANKNFRNVQPSFELIERLSTVCAHSHMLNSQDKAINVLFDDEADKIIGQFDRYCDLQINGSDREIKRQLWTRAHVKVMKLAALPAVGYNPYDPVITADAVNWAINIVTADIKNLLRRFNAGEIGIDNDETKQLAKLTAAIRQYVLSPWGDVSKYAGEDFKHLHSDRIIPYSFVQRKLASIAIFRKDRLGSKTALKRTLETLIERGDIKEMSRAVMNKDYDTGCRAFMIANPKAFDI